MGKSKFYFDENGSKVNSAKRATRKRTVAESKCERRSRSRHSVPKEKKLNSTNHQENL